MMGFIFQRIAQGIIVVAIVISLSFFLIRLAPGSPFSTERKLDPKIEAELQAKYGLDGSLGKQFIQYWSHLLHGDFGDSLKYTNRSVLEIIGQTLPNSLLLGSLSLLLAVSIGTWIGTLAAIHANNWQDRILTTLAITGICLPTFVIAPIFGLIFAIKLRWLPIAGWGNSHDLILPVICLAIPYAASCARLMRTSLLDVLKQDFLRTARAKGLTENSTIVIHALKIAYLPLVSYLGPLAAQILTGSMVIEEIFKIPGIGTFFINSVLNRDVFVVGGLVFVYGSLLVLFNTLVDIAYAWIDPRIRLK
jgi:ABC-type dipeptide/oligopeptide/nickel transport system permease component